MKYKTQGVCSREISFEVENNKLKNVKFVGGCAGTVSYTHLHSVQQCNRSLQGRAPFPLLGKPESLKISGI